MRKVSFCEEAHQSALTSFNVPQLIQDAFQFWPGRVGRTHLIPVLGAIPLTKLSTQQIDAFYKQKLAAPINTRAKRGKTSEKLVSARTVHHLRAILRATLNDAVDRRLIHWNPAAHVDGPTVPHHDVDVPSPEEARAILEAAQGHRLGTLFTLCMATGLRQGEALGLHWADVDLDAGSLFVHYSLHRIGGEYLFQPPKTKGSRSTLPLPALAIEALRTQRLRQLEERLSAGPLWEESDLVFATAHGRPLLGTNVTRDFQALLKQIGFRHMTFHQLRYATASLLLAQGAHPRVIMDTLRHSRIDLTMNTYTHLIPALRREAADMIDAALTAR